MPCETGSSDTLFWDTIFTMDITSAECLSNISTLVHSPSKISEARSLQGDQAQSFVDLIDQVLASPHLDRGLFRRCSQLLYKICKTSGMLPTSYVVSTELICVDEHGWGGGFADVSKGEYQGRPVAIKQLRIKKKDGFDKAFKRFCREVLIWKHLSHQNVLPLLGVSVSKSPPYLHIISEWMPNEIVTEYVRLNPEANRLRLLSEVASGVTYLHDLGIAHGDLKGENILVDHTGTARLADFGLMIMMGLFSNTVVSPHGTIRWMCPELLDTARFRADGRPSRESDCYALGMTTYQVLSGLPPFHQLWSPMTVACAVLNGERPGKPLNASSLGFTDTLWELLESCWSESASARPTALQLLGYLRPAALAWVPPPAGLYPTTEEAVSTLSSDTFGVSGVSLVYDW